MTDSEVFFAGNLAVGVALALVLLLSERLRGNLVVHVVGVVCLLAGFALMRRAAPEEVEARSFFLFLGALLAYAPFIIFLIFFWAGQIVRAASGAGEPVQMVKAYSAAKKAEAEGNYERAVMLYRRELERDPDDLEAARRLAEVLLKTNQVDEAIGELRLAATRTEDPEEEVDLILWVSDLLLNRKLDFDTALSDLDILRNKHKGSPAGERAQRRFQRVYILSEARKERLEQDGP